jgi:hypothetical protein
VQNMHCIETPSLSGPVCHCQDKTYVAQWMLGTFLSTPGQRILWTMKLCETPVI